MWLAAEELARHGEIATLDAQGLPIDKRRRHFVMCRAQYSVKRGTGDGHLLGAFLLLQTKQVFQPNRLCFLHGEGHFLQ
jgi:hypothetical protein